MTAFSAERAAAGVGLSQSDSSYPSQDQRDQGRDPMSYYEIAINTRGRIDLRTGRLEQRERRERLIYDRAA